MHEGGGFTEAYAEQLEEAIIRMMGAMEPLEEHHTACLVCGMETDPLNNMFLMNDLIAGTQAYRNYRAQHFLPVYYGDILCCPGTPGMAQYLQGGRRRVLDTEPGENPMQWKVSLEDAMSEALSLFGRRAKPVCFNLVFRKGLWIQRYRCRPMEEFFGVRLVAG